MFITITCCLVFFLTWRMFVRYKSFQHIPGPGIIDTIRHMIQVTDPSQHHLILTEMSRKYGPVMHVSQFNREAIVVSGYDALQEMLVKKGKEFGGRPGGPVTEYVGRDKGISGALEPDNRWHALKRISQLYLGNIGLNGLGKLLNKSAESMYQHFKEIDGKLIDPEPQIEQMLLKDLLHLILGDMPKDDDPLLTRLINFARQLLVVYTFNPKWDVILFDMFPWLRFFGVKPWMMIKKFNKLENEIWEEMKERSSRVDRRTNLINTFLSTDAEIQNDPHDERPGRDLPEDHVRGAILNIIFAGLLTTMNSFHAAINLFAHNPDIQDKIHQEIHNLVGSSNHEIIWDDGSMMPYTRAAIYELLRYLSPVADSVSHRCLKNSTIMGYYIPRNTIVTANLWAINHDPDLWSDPLKYKPERFLDDNGDILPADHLNRKHMMAFGAGTRVCLAESIALVRLFVLITSLIQRFKVVPAEGNTKELTDCLKYTHMGGVLCAPKYEVIFTDRTDLLM